jgi:ribosomal protein S18 acetylase RimI-like enzyme
MYKPRKMWNIQKESRMFIRKMTIADYTCVYDLWLNTPGMGLNDLDDSRQGIDKYLRRNPETCFVAEKDNMIIGVILCGNDGRRGYIHHTAVSVVERKNGVGTALVDAAVNALKNEGINKVALVVFSKNELGNSFWEKRGFTVREDLVYRNKSISELTRIDTYITW